MISTSRYKTLSDQISDAQIDGEKATDAVEDMRGHLYDSEVPLTDITKDRMYLIVNRRLSDFIGSHRTYIDALTTLVSLLQGHVEKNNELINDWLLNNSVQVTPTFALISAAAGYPIDPNNVEDGEYVVCL